MAVIENINVVMGAETAELDANIKKEINQLERLKQAARSDFSFGINSDTFAKFASGAAVIGVAKVSVDQFVQTAKQIDEVTDAANKLAMSFADLQTARLSLSQTSGLDQSSIDSALSKMQINLSDANIKGDTDLAQKLNAVGLNAGDLLKQGPVEAIKTISQATRDLKSPTDQLAIAYELFGKQGAQLVASLREGPAEIERMRDLANKLGVNLSDAQAEQVGSMNDAFGEVAMIYQGFANQVTAELAPAFQVIAEEILAGADGFGSLQQVLPQIVNSVAEFAGWMYDAQELVNVTATTLKNIATLNWGEVGKDITSALDFSTGEENVRKIELAREKAEQKAREKKMNPESESILEQYEREKNAAKALADEKKKAEEDAAKLVEQNLKAAKNKEDALLLEVELIKEANALRALGQSVNEQDIKLRREISNLTNGANDSTIRKLISEKEQLEEIKKIQESAASTNEKYKTPEDKLKNELRMLLLQKDTGLIDQKTFDKAAKDAEKSAFSNVDQNRGAVSAQAGSVEAYKLLLDRENNAKADREADKRIKEASLKALQEIASGVRKFEPIKAAR